MDGQRFDHWTRSLRSFSSRRTLGKLLAGSGLGVVLAGIRLQDAAAKCVKPGKKCKSKKGRKKKCCGGAKCRGKRCKCPGGREACGKRCCAKTAICQGNACRACDVCPSGCAFTSVQDAVDAAVAGGTVRICAGTFTGLVTVNKDLTLVGAGANRTNLSGGGATRVLFAAGGASVVVRDLTITGGSSNGGGGVRTEGALTLVRVNVTANSTPNTGGGLFNEGTLTIPVGSSVTGNAAANDGGGIFNFFGTVTLAAANIVTGNAPNNCAGNAVANCIG